MTNSFIAGLDCIEALLTIATQSYMLVHDIKLKHSGELSRKYQEMLKNCYEYK